MASTAYFAKWILLPDGNILTNGAVVVTGDSISSIGPRSSVRRTSKDRVVNLGKRLLLPGLINMHTHLEEGVMRGTVKNENETFISWTLKKDRRIKNAGADEVLSTIRLGIRESLANGITSIVDTTKTDISLVVFRDEPIRSWVIHEVSSENTDTEKDLIPLIQKRISQSRRNENIGIAPHALYSLNPSLHKAIIAITKQNDYLWACHMAESAEELQAFSEHLGDLFFHITRKREWPYGKTERGSMYYAITNNLIPNNGILYHCNYVGSEELSLLAAKNTSIVICSQYNKMLGHKRFPIEVGINRGINICLGTESPISLTGMDLFDELFQLKIQYPHIPANEMINWVTKNPAKALRCSDSLGSLAQGKKADIIGVRFSHDANENILEEMLLEEPEIDFVMVNGEEVIIGC